MSDSKFRVYDPYTPSSHDPTPRVHIRWMCRSGMPHIVRIERECFDRAWGEEDFLTALRVNNVIGMIAEVKGEVVAYFLYDMQKRHLEIINFAVSEPFRRKRIAFLMIEKLRGKLSSHRRRKLLCVVREGNLGFCLFLKKMGFTAIRVLRDYYDDTGEDGYAFEYRVEGTDDEYCGK